MKIHYLFVFAALTFFLSCRDVPKKRTSSEITLPVVMAVSENVPSTQEFVGQVYGSSDVVLEARAAGYLDGIHFREGSRVQKGQLLYTIEPTLLESQRAQAYSSLANARSNLINAQSNYDRVKPLAEIEAVSRAELDQATAQLTSSQAAVASAEAALTYATTQLSYTNVYAPISGIIGITNANKGAYVGPGSQTTALNTVSSVDSVLVRFFIPDQLFVSQFERTGTIPTFSNIRLIMGSGEQYVHKGRFNFIDRAVNQGTGSIEVQVSFPNKESLLRPGQFAKIITDVGGESSAVLIPQKCLTQLQGMYSVYVLDSANIAQQRIVGVGAIIDTMWVIKSGLNAGDRVVAEGFYKLRSGMKVIPEIKK